MNIKNYNEIQKNIRSITIKVIKFYKGNEPDYVNVKINDGKIEMFAKGILSKFVEFLIKYDEITVVELSRRKLQSILYKYLIDEILKETNLKCELIYEEYNFISNFVRVILIIKE